MSVYGKQQPHDREPATMRTGHLACGLTMRSWWRRPLHEALNHRIGLRHQILETKTDKVDGAIAAAHLCICPHVQNHGPKRDIQSP